VLFVVSFFISHSYSKKKENLKDWFSARYTVFSIISVLAITVFIALDLTKILRHQIIGHDFLVYGIMGKILYAEKSLDPIWIDNFSTQGFIYGIVRKPPSLSLILTWELIISSFFSENNDLYFKSVSIYYSILIVMILYILLSKKNIPLAILGVFALITAQEFFNTMLFVHIDSFRIFFHSVSLIFLFYSIKHKDGFSILMLGICSGLSTFSHTIGLVLAALNPIVLFIFLEEKLKLRFLKTLNVVSCMFLFGASHQIFNLVWGRNWLF
jgi:hypothetical protein